MQSYAEQSIAKQELGLDEHVLVRRGSAEIVGYTRCVLTHFVEPRIKESFLLLVDFRREGFRLPKRARSCLP